MGSSSQGSEIRPGPVTKRGPSARPLLWLILALPGLWIGWRWTMTPDAYGFGHAVKDSGDWAAWLLLGTLAVTPLRLAIGTNPFTRWLLLRRRDLGVASFAYAAGHTVIYLADKASLAKVVEEAGGADLLTGWLALALFVPLAVTSNDVSVRRLKRAWKRLHRLVYPAAVLVFVHWALTAFDPFVAYAHIAILAAIEGARIALQYRQRPI
ncbi:Sulfoxide reductase heme-binding subunit YedZ [Tsuneonella dongtanensis]|uniref:Sulfoxide reductase heme-binding subunit YedZ n=1 Tax=Tsuneonella dongtanensis TaxID=692370 RepID=A0A1B2ABZ0_9SPHN|nr:ferric reductase-like transmembrane domain-containing protein [Tsuneonella dongtanensis]ANY19673.1 Sulfoxide reductase heme-binding subunit YedZ [Tsuneonella dongtanensis]